MPITLKHKNAILTNTIATPLLVAGASETIRIIHLLVTCSTTGSGKLTLQTVDASASSQVANLLNAAPFTTGFPIEFYDGFLEPNDILRGGFTGSPTDPHIVIFYSSETP